MQNHKRVFSFYFNIKMARNLLIISSRLLANAPLLRKTSKIFNKTTTVPVCFTFFRNYSAEITNPSPARNEAFKDARIETISEFKSKHSPGAKFVTSKLQHLFDLPIAQIKDLVKKYPKLKKYTPDSIETNFNACTQAGITKEMLLEYPMILTIENINYKLLFLKQINVDINLIVPLMFANFFALKQIVQEARIEEDVCPHGNRIVYLSHLLNVCLMFYYIIIFL